MRGGTRESDEKLLAWLKLSDQRVPVKEIASLYGVNPRTVEEAMYQVRKADKAAHAGDDATPSQGTKQ